MQTMAPAKTRARQCAHGFTLIEVLVTIAIITLISSGIAVAAYRYYERAKVKAAYASAREIRQSVKASWLEDNSDCPGVDALISRGVLDEDSARLDPWGNSWRVACDGSRVGVSSNGKDRQPDTADDIGVPQREKSPP